jgi:hypothetical protein
MQATLPKQSRAMRPSKETLTNASIAELLAREAENADGHIRRAFLRAARSAFYWSEPAADLLEQGRSLTELVSIGPFLEKRILAWFENPPSSTLVVPELRRDFLTLADARRILHAAPDWKPQARGDLQMHTEWSDGSARLDEMAAAAIELGYEFISITDHAKKLKIAGGMDEQRLAEQGKAIEALNQQFKQSNKSFRILRSIELNLDPTGAGDMDAHSLDALDIVLGSFNT